MDLEERLRLERREARIADFALSTIIAGQPPGGGIAVPEAEDIRDLVRAARVVYAEIDHPSAPAEREAPAGGARQEHRVDDWQDGIWIDEDEPPPDA